MARSSSIRRIAVAVALLAPAIAHAQPAGGDPVGAMLKAQLDAETAARQAAEARLAAAEKALADQAAAVKAAADAAAAAQARTDELAKQLADEAKAREAATADIQKVQLATTPVLSRFTGITLQGFAQIDYALRQSSVDQLNDATGDPLNADRFNLRRSRLKVVADYGRVLGALELDANTNNGPQARVMNVEASFALTERNRGGTSPAVATMGIFKIPFGREVGEADTDRLFLERTTTERALFPGEYDLGARVAGSWRWASYAVAYMNGEPIGEKSFPLRDPNGAKDLVGRVGVDTSIGDVHIVGGFSALTGKGFHKGTPATKDTLVWRDLNEDGAVELNEIQNIPGQAATPSMNFSRFGVGGDLELAYPIAGLGLLSARGEVVVAANLDRGIVPADPVATTRDLRETGWYVQLVQELPRHLLAGVRVDHYDPDADATDRQSGNFVPTNPSFTSVAIDAALRFQNGRLIVEYDVNRNHQGRDATGVPTNLKDNALLVRAEVKF